MGKSKDPVGEFLFIVFKAIGSGFKSAFYGIKKLTSPGPIVGLLISVAICGISYLQQERILSIEILFNQPIPLPARYVLYWLLLLFPLLYLIILGSVGTTRIGKYDAVFNEINFTGKDNIPPALLSEKKDGKKTLYIFSSTIPLSEWKKARERLEMGLNCNIRQIREGSSKKVVELIAVPGDCKIPIDFSWDDQYISDEDGVLCIGQSDLEQITFDLNRTPHVIAAGETGSGKSVLMRCMLYQMACKGCRIFMMDFKGGIEFGKRYEQFGEVVTERSRALEVLQTLKEENILRQQLFRDIDVKNLRQFNQRTGQNLCRVVVFIDELAELMEKKGVDKKTKAMLEMIEGELGTLSRTARATGINLIFGVQRPDANVLPGQIKNNVPVRICGRFADRTASDIVLGNTDATELPDIKGRFLFKVGNDLVEFQSYFFDDDVHLQKVFIKVGDLMIEKAEEYEDEDYEDEYEEDEDEYEYEDEAPEEEASRGKQPVSTRAGIALDLNFDQDLEDEEW